MVSKRLQKCWVYGFLTSILVLALFAGGVYASITLPNTTYLQYSNGSSVALPAGTYFSIFYNASGDTWYVNDVVYPTPPPATPTPTPTPIPTVTPEPTPTPIPTASTLPPVTPTPTPTYNPDSRPTEALTLYFRSDSYSACGVSGYGLDADYTNEAMAIPLSVSGSVNVTYGFRVFLVTSASSSTELTDGVPVATITLDSNFTGALSSSWSCPASDVVLGFQALKIDVYVSTDGGDSWAAQAAFLSNVLMTKRLSSATWGFNLNINYTQTTDTYSSFIFGNTDYRSGVSNVVIQVPLQSEIQLWRLNRGDYIGFEIGAYVDIIGEVFYVLILLLVAGILYFRYGHFGTVAFFFVLFGGLGGLAWIFVPPWAAAVVSALVIIGTSFIVWRILR